MWMQCFHTGVMLEQREDIWGFSNELLEKAEPPKKRLSDGIRC